MKQPVVNADNVVDLIQVLSGYGTDMHANCKYAGMTHLIGSRIEFNEHELDGWKVLGCW